VLCAGISLSIFKSLFSVHLSNIQLSSLAENMVLNEEYPKKENLALCILIGSVDADLEIGFFF
jgi:hypothetical protein